MKSNEVCHVEDTFFHNELNTSDFPYEANRYWLFSSKLCPFAHRTEIMRMLSGLTDEIGLTIAASVQTDQGWNLNEHYESKVSSPNPVEGAARVPAIYKLSVPNYTGRASVPILFDTKTNTIVNNESAEIILQIDDVAVRQFQHQSLYPLTKRELVDSLIQAFEDEFVSPIYRAGFALDQQSYHTNFEYVFSYLAKLNEYLADKGPYLAGEELTLADVHAFPHLSRFDSVFHSLYRLNYKYLCDYAHIAMYMNKLGEISAFADTLDIQSLKEGYFLSWNQPTNGLFVPEGPDVNPRSGIAILA